MDTPIGARAAGLGHTAACLQDTWSLFNNVAGIAKTPSTVFAVTEDVAPNLPGAARLGATFLQPFSFGTAGFGVCGFGDALYSEQTISTGFANQFGLAAIGVRLNYIRYSAEGFGSKGVTSISFGGIADLTPKFSVGAHIYNLNQPVISKDDNERLPAQIVIGMAYKPITEVFFAAEVEKNLNHDPLYRLGIEYQPTRVFSFRTGVNINPGAAFVGVGLCPGHWDFSYAYHHSWLTLNHHAASVAYRFGKR